MHFPIFIYLCFVEDISENTMDKKVTEEIYPDLEGEEDFRISYYGEDHWKKIEEENNEDMGKVCDLR